MTNAKNEARSNETPARVPTEQTRQRSVSHPRYTLQEAERLAEVVFDKGPFRCDPDKVAQAAGYKNSTNGAFVGLRAAAINFGLIKSESGDLSVTETWVNVFNQENPDLKQQARREAISQPEVYRQLVNDYSDRQLPNLERLTRELYLTPKYGILKDAAPVAAKTFIESARYAEVLDAKGYLRFNNSAPTSSPDDEHVAERDPNPSPRTSAAGPTHHYTPNKTSHQPSVPQGEMFIIPEGLERIDIKLLNGQRAYLFVPQPLPYGEIERLKKWIGLLLEDPAPEPQARPAEDKQDGSKDGEPGSVGN